MGLITLLFSDPALFLILALTLLYSVIFHEVAHGWVAHLFGDNTAQRYGRLTLNPLSHLDTIGTLMLFLVGFGWAKPVPVDYYGLKTRRFGLISVALAGCLTNIFIAIIAIFIMERGLVRPDSILSAILPVIARINIILGAFNLIPIPPLDGSRILMSLLPEQAQRQLARIEPFGFFILAFLLFTGLLNPVINFMESVIYGLIALLLGFFK